MYRRFLPALVACAALAVPSSASALNFGKMFPKLPAFQFTAQQAQDLVQTELSQNPDPCITEQAGGIGSACTDEGGPEDSASLPAEYTYLGQILDHNLDFDHLGQPSAPVDPNTVPNFESFRWDLNDVFGRGPNANPGLYAADGKHLLIQGTLATPTSDGFTVVNPGTGNPFGVFDLPRNPDGTANIFEPRNDENKIISQIDASFIKFYNDFVDQGMSYATARSLTQRYYQLMILDDVLPHFVGQNVIDRYLERQPDGTYDLDTPNFANANFTPIEFSIGAYRFGHALVRANYHINDAPGVAVGDNNIQIFDLNNFQTGDLSGGAELTGPSASNPAGFQIQWKYFVPALNRLQAADGLPADQASSGCTGATTGPGSPGTQGCGDTGINFARKTQTSVSAPLFNLPAFTIPGCTDAASPVCNGSGNLLSRDFARGEQYGIASGQNIARALGCPVIPAASINPTSDAVFNQGTPLLYYVLAEAQKANRTLGCVGASIVAQTFLRVMWATPDSILHDGFRPNRALVHITPGKFTFGDLLIDDGLAPRLG
jgi:hypothetical protein